ncbi:MAG: response regulator [Myxococcales bacterium]|nr:response regulator [Myxococcales bacterium]
MEARILLVDGDRWMQRVVISTLRDQGYVFDVAGDGCAGLKAALARPPSLIISDVLMPGMNGWRLCRKLRALRQFSATPFMFLSGLPGDESRRHSFRLGADDYLSKPVAPRELVVRVRSALRRSLVPRAATRARVGRIALAYGRGVSGAIEDISLASLLVLLEMERKHGLMILTNCETGERCRLYLRDGRIVAAEMDGVTALRHAELLYHVLTWSRGAFEFKAVPVEMHDAVQASTTHLILEATRRLDEALAG